MAPPPESFFSPIVGSWVVFPPVAPFTNSSLGNDWLAVASANCRKVFSPPKRSLICRDSEYHAVRTVQPPLERTPAGYWLPVLL